MARDERLIKRARDLRRDGGLAERKMWELLRRRGAGGLKFRRQHPIGPFVADFACLSRKLVVEIDGDFHAFQDDADARRTAAMAREGWRVVRFTASEVVRNPEGVRAEIERLLVAEAPSPGLSPDGGEE